MNVYAKNFDLMTDAEINHDVWKFEISYKGPRIVSDDVYLHGFGIINAATAHAKALEGFILEYSDHLSPDQLSFGFDINLVYSAHPLY
jgi:hypothetical protein